MTSNKVEVVEVFCDGAIKDRSYFAEVARRCNEEPSSPDSELEFTGTIPESLEIHPEALVFD